MANHSSQATYPGMNFFRFSRSQRTAMVLLIVFALLFSLFLRQQKSQSFFSTTESDILEVAELETFVANQDAKVAFSAPQRYEQYNQSSYTRIGKTTPTIHKARLFTFDPNTISMEKLQELGLSERTAQNFINYREKGGQFRKPEDLKKMYSLHPEEAQRLMPFVRIEAAEASNNEVNEKFEMMEEAKTIAPAEKFANSESTAKINRKLMAPIDINLADSFSLTLLPGIGAKRAGAICRYRERLGGFASVEQIGETYGLPDSVFRQILPYIMLSSGPVNKLSVNNASETDLKNHPYIGWKMAKIIVAYRNQHGPFQSVDDLLKIYAIKKDWLEKVKPHLQVEN
jgi:competence protein ComEA